MKPGRLLSNGYLQSFVAYYWPKRRQSQSERHFIDLPGGDRLTATLDQALPVPSQRKVVLIHGLAGCEDSPYVLRAAQELLKSGIDVVRLNMRGMGPGANLAKEAFHADQGEDILHALNYFSDFFKAQNANTRLCVVGFSLGGLMLLKAAGKYDPVFPKSVDQLVSVSAPLDLEACVEKILLWNNKIFDLFFVRKMKRYYRERKELWGDETIDQLSALMSIRDFDGKVSAVKAGFSSAEEYYRQSSAKSWISKISRPKLLICAKNDPLIDWESYESLPSHENLEVVLTENGGHAAFMNGIKNSSDRWWFEPRLTQFVKSLDHSIQ